MMKSMFPVAFLLLAFKPHSNAFLAHCHQKLSNVDLQRLSKETYGRRRFRRKDQSDWGPSILASFKADAGQYDFEFVRTMRFFNATSRRKSVVTRLSSFSEDVESLGVSNGREAHKAEEGKMRLVEQDFARKASTYEVTLPLYETSEGDDSAGVILCQISKGGRMSDFVLVVDTLQYMFTDVAARLATKENSALDASEVEVKQQLVDLGGGRAAGGIISTAKEEIDSDLEGVIVYSVRKNGVAWKAGVRPGDVLVATSATLGGKLWPKSTLDGVRSAMTSRKNMSNKASVVLRFRRSREHIAATEVVETFELTLTRPIGINVEDNSDGSVIIKAFSEEPLSIAKELLRKGDRIIAADSSLGTQMWPVSNAEGLVSSVTSRLPGQPVRFRFERVVQVGEWTDNDSRSNHSQNPNDVANGKNDVNVSSVAPALEGAVDGYRSLNGQGVATERGFAVIKSAGSKTHKLLLTRCRDVLRQYSGELVERGAKSGIATFVPALAADRVLEALADASAPLDSHTLALAMTAYSKCDKPEKAMKAFEAAVGISSDGTAAEPSKGVIKGKKNPLSRIAPDLDALTIYTASALLRAHALRGDVNSAVRVLAAMEGRDEIIGGKAASLWPFQIMADTRCYNIVLAAAAKAGGQESIDVAIDIFDNMPDPGMGRNGGRNSRVSLVPCKNIVTYNTMLNAFAREGRVQDAYTVFYSMEQAGIKPDKISYTTLIKATMEDGDAVGGRDLLKQMKMSGIEADVLTYNTVIKGLCKRLKWYEAKSLASEMEAAGVSPDSVTYGLLMDGLLKVGKPGACLALFEGACADERTAALTENVELYTTAISAASATGDYERTLDLVTRMKRFGVIPNLKTLTTLMNACLIAGRADIALDVYEEIKTSCDVDGIVLTLVIRAQCDRSDFSSAAAVLTTERDGYHKMSGKEVMISYNYLLNSSLKAKRYEVARAALVELLESGYIPSKISFKAILDGLGLVQNWKKRRYGQIDTAIRRNAAADATEKFDFLLFVLDSLEGRQLLCDASFFSSILFEGARVGGSRKYVSSLLSRARIKTNEGVSPEHHTDKGLKWVELTNVTTDAIRRLESELSLPTMRVRVKERERSLILAAERAVSSTKRRRRRVKVAS